MSTRRKQQREAKRLKPPGTLPELGREAFEAAPGSELSRMFRRSCSECGSTMLDWMSISELQQRVQPESRQRVAEATAYVGDDAQAWLCTACGNFGVMSGGEFG